MTPNRCPAHDVALSPLGDCPVCRREAERATTTTPRRRSRALQLLELALGLALAGGGVVLAIRALPEPPPTIERDAVPLAGAPPDAAVASVSDPPELPATELVPMTRAERRLRERALREAEARARAGRGSEASRRERAAREPEHEPSTPDPELPAALPERLGGPRAPAGGAPLDRHARAAARSRVSITMYSASWCGYCTRARQWLRSEGIRYREYDVDESPVARQRLRAINPRGGVPTFEIDGQVVVGFSAASLGGAIDRAARAHR